MNEQLNSKVKIIIATLDDYPIIQNMARFYVYDRTPFMGWEPEENGMFECIDFKHYFESHDKKAYLVRTNHNELVGFVLLDKQKLVEPIDWNMGEFFILAKFQSKGVAWYVAEQIFKAHPGQWSVAVMPENLKAYKFWRRAVVKASGDNFTEIFKNKDELDRFKN